LFKYYQQINYMSSKTPTSSEIYSVIMRNMKALRKSGVLTARPGYKISRGKVIDKPSIVVTVVKKKDAVKPKDRLPAEIDNIPVDVREATPMQVLRSKDPDSFHLIQALGPQELHEPESQWECDMQTGKPMSPPSAAVKTLIASAKAKKTKIQYTPAPKAPLTSVKGNITITAYSSPDDGYTVLSNYLKGTKKDLTIGMYDFTSGDLLKDVVSTIKSGGLTFTMVLDHPPLNKTHNQTDEVTRQTILANDRNAKINWALTDNDPEVTGWIYPSAYHIKVVVRDQTSFWLSSGNFNVSNQPNFAADDPTRGSFKTADRDWHVIVEHKGLAQLYEDYIQHDFAVATALQASAEENAAKAAQVKQARLVQKKVNTALNKLPKAARTGGFANPPSVLGKHRVFPNAPVTLQPLLTPDPGMANVTPMYETQIIALLKAAQKSIFVQLQYIAFPAKASATDITNIVQALGDALKRGLDVRIIVSEFQKDQDTEHLADFGLDTHLLVMQGVHNKGIVVDTKIALVSSQNWSEQGVSANRDAGLIIENADIAAFFENIFMDDWKTRAHPPHMKTPATPKIAKSKTTKSKSKTTKTKR
jgi:phosphatidylserine/phosphatidylglycerophosphate/cardiolipin synthase-like enzyme